MVDSPSEDRAERSKEAFDERRSKPHQKQTVHQHRTDTNSSNDTVVSTARRTVLGLAVGALSNAVAPVQTLAGEVDAQQAATMGTVERPRSDVASRSLTVEGTGASPGQEYGSVHRIVVPNQLDRYPSRAEISGLQTLESGEIAVMSQFYPCMIEGVKDAAGLVVTHERSLTGRGSVMARELSVPAVIDCPDALDLLDMDEPIWIDGKHGILRPMTQTSSTTPSTRL